MPPRLRWATLVPAVVVVLTLFRSAMFVFRAQLSFDSDQAVFGLMAKHLIEGRAFPLFMYGQNYVLAVESWLAAPVFLIAGVSVAALKFPLLLINIAVGLLLVALLRRETGLGAAAALIASLVFVLAPPGTSAALLDATGGNVEPFLYVLLLWLTRRHPAWFGLILGVGFLQREFAAFGAIAIVLIQIARGAWRDREEWQRGLRALRIFVEVWLAAQFLRQMSSALGPGSDASDVVKGNNLTNALGRLCFDPRALGTGIAGIVTVHWPRLFGTVRRPVADFNIQTTAMQGWPWSGPLFGVLLLVLIARIAVHARASEAWWKQYEFCGYLILVGALSALACALTRCGDVTVLHYDLLSIAGAVGLAAWGLGVESCPWIRRLEMAGLVCWAILSAAAHAQVWDEYMGHPPVADKVLIMRSLEARGIRYARSDYWIAYYVTFLSNERIIVAADDYSRIVAYDRDLAAHRSEAIWISRQPCGDARPVVEGAYFCRLP
jgi:hypothetical protein